jgi:type IV pilus assembly protein PilA
MDLRDTSNYSTVKNKLTKGFTLIEVLLVIAILAILAAIVIIAINPAKQLGSAQDAQRRNDVRSILDAVHQYSIDNSGLYPQGITYGNDCINEALDICQAGNNCGSTSLEELVEDGRYLTELPNDPSAATDEITGYKILVNDGGRVSVCAPNTYSEEPIVVTR